MIEVENIAANRVAELYPIIAVLEHVAEKLRGLGLISAEIDTMYLKTSLLFELSGHKSG